MNFSSSRLSPNLQYELNFACLYKAGMAKLLGTADLLRGGNIFFGDNAFE